MVVVEAPSFFPAFDIDSAQEPSFALITQSWPTDMLTVPPGFSHIGQDLGYVYSTTLQSIVPTGGPVPLSVLAPVAKGQTSPVTLLGTI